MKVKLLKGVVAAGKAQKPGAVVEIDEKQAAYLIRMKKAVAVGKPDEPKK